MCQVYRKVMFVFMLFCIHIYTNFKISLNFDVVGAKMCLKRLCVILILTIELHCEHYRDVSV